jgi:hypothetical protein
LLAVYHALQATYTFLTPDFWGKTVIDSADVSHPFEKHAKYLNQDKKTANV